MNGLKFIIAFTALSAFSMTAQTAGGKSDESGMDAYLMVFHKDNTHSLDGGKTYTQVGKPQSGDILSTDVAGGFIGNLLGLYSTANNNVIP